MGNENERAGKATDQVEQLKANGRKKTPYAKEVISEGRKLSSGSKR